MTNWKLYWVSYKSVPVENWFVIAKNNRSVAARAKSIIREQLNKIGVNLSSVFPSLDSVAKSLRDINAEI